MKHKYYLYGLVATFIVAIALLAQCSDDQGFVGEPERQPSVLPVPVDYADEEAPARDINQEEDSDSDVSCYRKPVKWKNRKLRQYSTKKLLRLLHLINRELFHRSYPNFPRRNK